MDGMEKILCVRDYIVRRLWVVFDQMEDDLVQGALTGSVSTSMHVMQLLPDSENWFGLHAKQKHDYYMEHMMFRGLSFLKDVFTADKERRRELILSASARSAQKYNKFLTRTLSDAPNC